MKVFYLVKEPEIIVLGKRLIKTPRTYHLYLPDHDLEFYGHRFLLPGYYDIEKREFVVDLRGRNLEKSYSLWLARKLEEIPLDAIQLEVDEEDAERLIKAYREWEKEEEKFAKELEKILPLLKATGVKTFKIESKPFEYQDKFSEVVEEFFMKYVDERLMKQRDKVKTKVS